MKYFGWFSFQATLDSRKEQKQNMAYGFWNSKANNNREPQSNVLHLLYYVL